MLALRSADGNKVEAEENPSKTVMAAGGALVLGGTAVGTFVLADMGSAALIESIQKDKPGDVKAITDGLTVLGVGKIAGGLVIAYVGGRYVKSEIGMYAAEGIAAGLMISGANDLVHAHNLAEGKEVLVEKTAATR